MMMSSGNSGMTSSTSVTRPSTPSQTPPRKAEATPTSIAITVAPNPASSAISSTGRVPQTTCANMSWPKAVVPSRCCADGPRLRG